MTCTMKVIAWVKAIVPATDDGPRIMNIPLTFVDYQGSDIICIDEKLHFMPDKDGNPKRIIIKKSDIVKFEILGPHYELPKEEYPA